MHKIPLLLVAALGLASVAATAEEVDGDSSHLAAMRCQGRRLKALDEELNRLYQRALAAMPEHEQSDARKSREQLRKSERAWLSFMRENCALVGGLEGGSNGWVSTLTGDCEEKELKDRIAFLESIARGDPASH